MSTDLEIVDLTEIVGDLETPCDYAADDVTICRDEPARWALIPVPCARCHAAVVRLACTTCKDARTASGGAVYCACGEFTVPARKAYSRIEAL